MVEQIPDTSALEIQNWLSEESTDGRECLFLSHATGILRIYYTEEKKIIEPDVYITS